MLQGHLGWMRRISWPLSIQIYLLLLQQQVEIPSQASFAQADRGCLHGWGCFSLGNVYSFYLSR